MTEDKKKNRRLYLQSIRSLGELNEEEKVIVQKLALRAYHLPGYTFWNDWWQYFFNNHPIFGLCCHHPLHPVGLRERIVFIIGSIACGLAATSGVIIWYYYNGLDLNVIAISLQLNNVFSGNQGEGEEFVVTKGMVSCWTIAGLINSAFDILLWYISACPCCQVGGCCYRNTTCSRLGGHIAHFLVVIFCAICLCVVMYRVHLEAGEDVTQEHFSFLETYLITTGLSLLVYRPVMSFILFTGVLGCFRLPFLGGRPMEKRRENQHHEDEDVPDSNYISYDGYEDEENNGGRR